MSNIVMVGSAGASSATVTMLASLSSVPTSRTATGGTENWQKYDAIYFECTIHYSEESNTSIFTNSILTHNVSIGSKYQPFHILYGNMTRYIYVLCYFSENVLNVYKEQENYDVVKLNIYGVKF